VRSFFAALLLLAASSAVASEPAEITVVAPAGCPDRAAFLDLVAQHADGAEVRVPADVRVEHVGARWIASVELAGAEPRRFEGAACAEVMDAAALVVAFAIEEPESRPVAAVHEPVPAAAPIQVTRISRSAPPARASVGARLRAGAFADAGTLPAASVGASFAASAWRGLVGLELSTALYRASSASLAAGDVAPVDLWTVGLRGCRSISFAAVCLGGEAGRMSADARQLEGGGAATALWSAVSAAGLVRRGVGRWAHMVAGLEILVPLVRPRFVLDDDTGLHRPSPMSGRALVGLEVDLR
jgi:hypothetical protein